MDVIVKGPGFLKIGNRRYAGGECVRLKADEARRLLALGVVRENKRPRDRAAATERKG